MSAFTSKIRELLNTRYWYSKSTSAPLQQDELSPYDVVLTRLVCLINPSRAAIDGQGNLNVLEGSIYPYEHPAAYYEGINFTAPMSQFWARTIDNDEYLDNYWWFRNDYTVQQMIDFGLDAGYASCIVRAKKIMVEFCKRIDWIPELIKARWKDCIDAGGIPHMWNTDTIVNSSKSKDARALPSFLKDKPLRQFAWNNLCAQFHPINREITAIGTRIYNEEAAKIQSSIEFWQGVSKWTGVDAITGLWEDLKGEVRKFNGHQQASRRALDEANTILEQNPYLKTPENLSKVNALQAEVANNSAVIRQKLPNSIIADLENEAGGLGIAPVAVAIIGGVVLATITASIAVIANTSAETDRKCVSTVSSLIKQRESADTAWFQTEMEKVQKEIDDLGFMRFELSQAEYTTALAQLNQRKDALNAQLMARRQQTQAAVSQLTKDLENVRKDDALTSALTALKGAAIPISIGLGLLILGPSIARMLPGKK